MDGGAEGDGRMAQSFFSRIPRAEVGILHHIAGDYLDA